MKIAYLRRSIYRLLKQNKCIFYCYEWLKWHKEIELQKQANSANNLKPVEVIKEEERLVKQYWKLGAFHYYRYGLQYKSLTTQQLLDYVPTYYFHKNIEKHHQNIDTIKYGDKLVQAELFESRKIPTANTIMVWNGSRCYDIISNEDLNPWEVIETRLKNTENKLFFKPTGNCGGAGIMVMKKVDSNYLLNGVIVSSWDDVIAKLERNNIYIIQDRIIQSKQLNEINPSSVNTIRVVVQNENNQMTIKTCILRMGRQGKEVDNSAQGGISIKVDSETGYLGDCATAEHGAGELFTHPDSQYEFKNKKIENWDDVKTQIELIANKLIDFKDIALDIAITMEKVILIEFNFRYGIEHQQCVLGGMRRILNIPNN